MIFAKQYDYDIPNDFDCQGPDLNESLVALPSVLSIWRGVLYGISYYLLIKLLLVVNKL